MLLWFGIAGGGLLRRGRRLLTGVLVVALLYMLGRYTPLYALAFDYVPGINLFRRPVDGAFVFVAALAILAGHLLGGLRAGRDYRGEPLWRSAAVAAGAIALTAWAVAFSAKSGHALRFAAAGLQGGSHRPGRDRGPVVGRAVAARTHRRGHLRRDAGCGGELVWWNAASSLNAEPPGILFRAGASDGR